MKQFFLIFFLLMSAAYSQDINEKPCCEYFEEEGNFVEVPADASFYLLWVPGAVAGVGLMLYACSQTNIYLNTSALNACLVFGGLTGRVGYYFTGWTLFLAKNLFYDLPVKALKQAKKKTKKFSKAKAP